MGRPERAIRMEEQFKAGPGRDLVMLPATAPAWLVHYDFDGTVLIRQVVGWRIDSRGMYPSPEPVTIEGLPNPYCFEVVESLAEIPLVLAEVASAFHYSYLANYAQEGVITKTEEPTAVRYRDSYWTGPDREIADLTRLATEVDRAGEYRTLADVPFDEISRHRVEMWLKP